MTPCRRRHTGLRIAIAIVAVLAVMTWGPRLEADRGRPHVALGPAIVAAASPEPSAPGGDTRSPGEGPGLVGAPFLAILGVAGLGLVTAGATLVYLRLAGGPATGGPGGSTAGGRGGPGRRRTRRG